MPSPEVLWWHNTRSGTTQMFSAGGLQILACDVTIEWLAHLVGSPDTSFIYFVGPLEDHLPVNIMDIDEFMERHT